MSLNWSSPISEGNLSLYLIKEEANKTYEEGERFGHPSRRKSGLLS